MIIHVQIQTVHHIILYLSESNTVWYLHKITIDINFANYLSIIMSAITNIFRIKTLLSNQCED